MLEAKYPSNLIGLYKGETELTDKSPSLIEAYPKLNLHFEISERAMDILDVFRQVPAADKDVETLQSLGLRMFNSFATATKLMLSGYYQISALILRDLLQTTFLVEWFRTERSDILRWLDDEIRQKHFRPGQVRKKLDDRDGVTTGTPRRTLQSVLRTCRAPHVTFIVHVDAARHAGKEWSIS